MNNNDIEYKSVEEIKAFQEELLHKALTYLQANSPYYKRMFKSYNIDIKKIRHLEDLQKKKTFNCSTRSFCVATNRKSSTTLPHPEPWAIL